MPGCQLSQRSPVPSPPQALTCLAFRTSLDAVLGRGALSSKSRNGCRIRCPRNLPSRHFASSRIDDRRRPEARILRRELYAARLVCALYRSSNAAAKYAPRSRWFADRNDNSSKDWLDIHKTLLDERDWIVLPARQGLLTECGHDSTSQK